MHEYDFDDEENDEEYWVKYKEREDRKIKNQNIREREEEDANASAKTGNQVEKTVLNNKTPILVQSYHFPQGAIPRGRHAAIVGSHMSGLEGVTQAGSTARASRFGG